RRRRSRRRAACWRGTSARCATPRKAASPTSSRRPHGAAGARAGAGGTSPASSPRPPPVVPPKGGVPCGRPLVLLLALAGATPAAAAVIEVETLAIVDGGTFPPCELDEAILSANADFAVGGCSKGNGADVIVFDVEGTIELPAELPTIEEDLTIRGPGADQLTLD